MRKIVHYIEASLGTIYHYTSVNALFNILKTSAFKLNSAERASDTEHAISGSKKAFFLSLTRSKVGGYHTRSVGNWGVLLDLNYDVISRHHEIKPVDYWGKEFRAVNQNMNEMEERLYSDNKWIKFRDISKVINSIHMLIKPEKWPDERANVLLRRALILAKTKRIPIYVYDQEKYWLAMRPQFAVPLSKIIPTLRGNEEYGSSYRKENQWLGPYYELYMKPLGQTLSDKAKRIMQRLEYTYDLQQELVQFKNTLHNDQKSEYMGKISPLLKKHGGAEGFLKHLAQKYFPEGTR